MKQGEKDKYKYMYEDDKTSESNFDIEEERIVISLCDEVDIQFLEFNEVTDMEDSKIHLGMYSPVKLSLEKL